MQTKIAIGIAAVAAFALAGTANAGHFTGFYVGLEGGWSNLSDEDVSNDTIDPIWPNYSPTTATFDNGWGAFIKGGFAFPGAPPQRLELELGYRSNDLDVFTVQGTDYNGGGEVKEFSQMLNLIWVPSLSDRLDLQLGVGVGGDAI